MGAFYFSISRSTCFSGRVLFAPVYLEFQSPNLSTFKDIKNRLQEIDSASQAPAPGYIGWRNRFIEIDSWAPYKVTNSGSGSKTMISNI